MLSDRTLETRFRMRPAAVALWGDVIRWTATMLLALLVVGLTTVYVQTVRNTIAIRHLQDFGVFYDSAARVRSGGALYTDDRQASEDSRRPANLDPPHFHVLMWPLTYLPPAIAFWAWTAISATSLIMSVAIICRSLRLDRRSIGILCTAAYLSPAMLATLMTGQVGLLLLLPFTIAWHCARRHREARAGAWLGACGSVKPPLLLFVPCCAVVGRWRFAVVASVTCAALFGAGVVLFGLDAHREWIHNLLSVTWTEHYMNASVLGLVERSFSAGEWQHDPLINRPSLVGPVWALMAAGIGAGTLWRIRRVNSVDRQFLLTTIAALLLSPLSWVYYFWFLMPPLASWLTSTALVPRSQLILIALALAGLFAPPPLPWAAVRWSGLATVTVGSIYCWALVALWAAALREPDVPA